MPTENISTVQQIDQQLEKTTYSTTGTNPDLDSVAGYKALKDDMDNVNSLIRRTMRANGIYDKSDMMYNTVFYRFPRIDPFNYVEGTREYCFFIKPDLNILDNGNLSQSIQNAQVPYFYNLYNNGYRYTTLQDLCYSNGGGCPFVRILSNRKTSNIDVPDIAVEELETAQNMYGTRIFYPKSSMKSDEDIDFTVEFEDTKHLEVYNFFKAYDYYRQLKWLGIISPRQEDILNKILHDHMGLYKFVLDDDGETILFWCKWTGLYPKIISRSAFSEIPEKGPLKITVGFKQSGFFEDMVPNIISDFNSLVANWVGSKQALGTYEYDLWDDEIQAISGEFVDYPYISIEYPTTENGLKFAEYRLKWGKYNQPQASTTTETSTNRNDPLTSQSVQV